jgi:orotidine-5'-phosphate decarboxylase
MEYTNNKFSKMTKQELFENIQRKKSFLCVGLDTDATKIPEMLYDESDDAIFDFNKAIIDATADLCVAYKPNLAFYESLGLEGWEVLERTVDYIRENYPDQFIIADAKRGDIGNTSAMYARTFFGNMDFDSVTVAPYMGEDSVTPFLTYEGKWVTLLALTSNKGAYDFQFMKDAETGERLFEKVLKTSLNWGTDENMMYVVGATKAEMLTEIRAIIPEHFLLVPGVGAQGGSLQEVAKYGLNSRCGLLVNSSRQIIYASSEKDFAQAARKEAMKIQTEMEEILQKAQLIH